MIIFENQGEIDPQAISLIGVNVKQGDSPIGFFGTGLKYAVARACAWGAELEVQSGTKTYRFATERTEVRGKPFQIIRMIGPMDALQLGRAPGHG